MGNKTDKRMVLDNDTRFGRRSFLKGFIFSGLAVVASQFLPPQLRPVNREIFARACPGWGCTCLFPFSGWYLTCTSCGGWCYTPNIECSVYYPGTLECEMWTMDFIVTEGDAGCCAGVCDFEPCCVEGGRSVCYIFTCGFCPNPWEVCGW